jgi:hypothetical protein
LLGIDFRGAPRGNQQCGDGVRQAINHGLYALALAASTTASVGLHPSFVILDEHYTQIMHQISLLVWCLVHKILCTKVRQILFVGAES